MRQTLRARDIESRSRTPGCSADTTEKSALKFETFPIWKFDVSSQWRYIMPQSLQTFVWGGGQVCVPHKKTSVKFPWPLWGAKSSLVFTKSLSNLAILLIIILRCYFLWRQRIFPINLSKSTQGTRGFFSCATRSFVGHRPTRLRPKTFRVGHFLRLDRNRKPRLKSLWNPR